MSKNVEELLKILQKQQVIVAYCCCGNKKNSIYILLKCKGATV